MVNVSNVIKRMIDSSPRTHREIANLVGITEASMSRYYRGNRVPNADTFFKIARACGDFSMDGKPSMKISKVAKIFKNCSEDSLNAEETQNYMETVLTALKIYKMFAE